MAFIHKFITKTLQLGQSSTPPVSSAKSLWELACKDIKGNDFSFESLKGKVLIISNVASFCGFTNGHYAGFKDLLEKYGDKLQIIAFPCGQFMGQEYNDPDKVCSLAEKKSFKGLMMEKVEVNGKSASPVFNFLKLSDPKDTGTNVEWNFEAFLIHPVDGTVVRRYRSKETPDKYVEEIEKLLPLTK